MGLARENFDLNYNNYSLFQFTGSFVGSRGIKE